MVFDRHRFFLSSVAKITAAALVALVGIGTAQPDPVHAELDPATSTAILDALADERKAEAYYQAVIDRFGEVKPFSNVIAAERRHAEAIEKLCTKYDVAIPAASTEKVADVPETVKDACAAAVEAEKRNIALYDDLLPKLTEPDVRQTFERLQTASKDHHLPAFTRCVEGGGHAGHGAAGAKSAAGSCGQCGMGGGCGCSRAPEYEKKARAAAGGGCGCAKRAAQEAQ
jgi:hypothetical protein